MLVNYRRISQPTGDRSRRSTQSCGYGTYSVDVSFFGQLAVLNQQHSGIVVSYSHNGGGINGPGINQALPSDLASGGRLNVQIYKSGGNAVINIGGWSHNFGRQDWLDGPVDVTIKGDAHSACEKPHKQSTSTRATTTRRRKTTKRVTSTAHKINTTQHVPVTPSRAPITYTPTASIAPTLQPDHAKAGAPVALIVGLVIAGLISLAVSIVVLIKALSKKGHATPTGSARYERMIERGNSSNSSGDESDTDKVTLLN